MGIAHELLYVVFVLSLVGIVLVLLAKLRILPMLLYGMAAGTFFPVWVEEHHLLYLGIMALFVLYAVLYWGVKFVRWRQEEHAAQAYLLATATPLYAAYPAPVQNSDMPEYDEDEEDYWYDR